MAHPRSSSPLSLLAVGALAWGTAIAGCATTGGGGGGGGGAVDTEQFPSKADLDRVAARALPTLKADVRADVASWTLAGPLPDRFGDAPVAPGGLHDLLLDAVPPAVASENIACAARELARFLVANDNKLPEARLKSWILVRCGVTSGDVGVHPMTWTQVPEKTKDEEVWGDSRKGLGEMIDGMKKNAGHVGIAFARDTKAQKAVAVVVSTGRADATLEPTPQVLPADAPTVAIAGTLAQPAEVVYAYVTKGLLDAAECDPDLAVVLPRFRFLCPVDAADASARIDIGARKKDRVLGESVASLLVVRDASTASSYHESVYDTGDSADVLESINRVRATAGRGPLRATAAQSESVKKVAPHYFANLFADDRDPHVSDVVALGLMAGWDVSELTIHDAGFATLLDVSGGGDDLLGYALDHPLPRAVLLDEKMSAAAVGPAQLDNGLTGALVVTYEALVPPDHAKAAGHVFEKLRAVRKQRGLGVTGAIPTEQIMLDAARELQAGGAVDDVAQKALDASVQTMNRPFTIWMMEVHDLEHMSFPEQLLTARTTYVAVAVATRKRPKSAWGSTVVLLLGFVDDTQVAMVNR